MAPTIGPCVDTTFPFRTNSRLFGDVERLKQAVKRGAKIVQDRLQTIYIRPTTFTIVSKMAKIKKPMLHREVSEKHLQGREPG